ncbi:DUF6088 family protein [Sporosarcina limicola]|uniref:Uncharacterized protein n=1 Tax=Sporosarcina limicola TaxID=34101 RepID=A0A927RCY6_9BACL|nr:DUF6088 family protein [Sporosarcina limicola]MBE1554850.1 hypothetical protein [Sporosarcina limicola]
MNLYNYLVESYGYDEPIFLDELTKSLSFMKPNTIRQNMARLVKHEQINRFQTGIYFISKPNVVIKSNSLSINKIISKRYIVKENERIGYLTGLSFANSIRLTTQNPVNIEVVSSNTSSVKHDVDLKKVVVTLKKPKVKISNSNYKTLQVLDLLNSFEKVSEKSLIEAKSVIAAYMADSKIQKQELNQYLNIYPKKVALNLIEGELYDDITQ